MLYRDVHIAKGSILEVYGSFGKVPTGRSRSPGRRGRRAANFFLNIMLIAANMRLRVYTSFLNMYKLATWVTVTPLTVSWAPAAAPGGGGSIKLANPFGVQRAGAYVLVSHWLCSGRHRF